MKTFEVIDHPADTGLKIYGKNLEALFRHGALGFYSLVTDLESLQIPGVSKPETVSRMFDLRNQELSELFFDWLKELIFYFSAQKLIFTDFRFLKLEPTRAEVEASGILFDPKRHEPKIEIKAVTYHRFKVEKTPSGFEAYVIFDI